MAISVVAKDHIVAEHKEKVIEILKEMVMLTRKENGCVSYALHEVPDDPGMLVFVETWESKEALEAHMNSEHFTRIMPSLQEYKTAPPDIEIFNVLI